MLNNLTRYSSGQVWLTGVEMRIWVSAILVCMVPMSVGAQDPDWLDEALEQKNPNELAFFVQVDEHCPVEVEAVESTVKSVFVRSRIKPMPAPAYLLKDLHLSIAVNCLPVEGKNPAFMILAYFGDYKNEPAVLYDWAFNQLGVGSSKSILTGITASTERAITAYLKANFDLGD